MPDIQINQPVGLSFQHDYSKYIFETIVVGFESSVNQSQGGRVILELPERIEQIQRRAYARVPVPCTMHIETLFWHRGYTDEFTEAPMENYWKGKLVDLSAGGAQILIDAAERENFRIRQVVGMQFTPVSLEKPIIVESQVIHVADSADNSTLTLGVEFLGLEARGQARRLLYRIKDIVEQYDRLNKKLKKQMVTS